jgi:hypothetical protein
VSTVLLVLLAAEGATILQIGPLLTVHAFIGMLLVPVVLVKLATTGWRLTRYYLGGAEYVVRGPPHIVLRALVAPVVVASTIVVFGSGVALLALDERHGTLVGLHKASFVVWFGAMSLHVLARAPRLLRALGDRVPGLALRVGLAGAAFLAGAVLATATLPAAERLQDGVSAYVGVDRS